MSLPHDRDHAVPAAGQRSWRPWLGWILAGLALVAATWALHAGAPVIDGLRAARIDAALRSEAGGLDAQATAPAPGLQAGGAWQPVALPDNWDSSRPAAGGRVWYRLRLPEAAVRDAGPLAIYLPAVGMNAQLFINGHELGSIGRMAEPLTRNFYTPLLFALPRALLRPAAGGQAPGRGAGDTAGGGVDPVDRVGPGDVRDNVLDILVAGYPQHRNGLGEVYVGADDALRPAWRWRGFWQNTGTLVSSVLTVALGLYVLMLWSRERGNAVFGWFGLAATVWGVRNLNLVITDLPLPNLLWSQLGVVGAVFFVGFFALFTLRYCESESKIENDSERGTAAPRWQTWPIWLFMVGSSLALLWPDSFETSRANFRWVGLLGVTLTCWTQMKLSALAWRQRTAEAGLIAAAGVIYIGLMVHDYHVTNDKQMLGQYYLRQYAALPLFLAIGNMLTQRYLAALDIARSTADSLSSQVRAQHDRLAHNFQQLRDAEREHAQAQERERLMRDLHDGLGLHLLSALIHARSPSADATVMADILQDCLDDLRMAVDSLAGDERDPATILGSLRFRMAPRLEAAGLALDWTVEGDMPELHWLDPEKALHLLRIVQEALTNAMRHSGASRIGMALRQVVRADGLPGVEVSVVDNGRGFDVEAQRRAGARRGIGNMTLRAGRLGADFDMRADASGSRLTLVLPLRQRPAQTDQPA